MLCEVSGDLKEVANDTAPKGQVGYFASGRDGVSLREYVLDF